MIEVRRMAIFLGLLTGRGQKGDFWVAINVLNLYLVVVPWLCLLCEKSVSYALKICVLVYYM